MGIWKEPLRVVETLAEADHIEPTKLPFESGGGYGLLNEAQEYRRHQRRFCGPPGGCGESHTMHSESQSRGTFWTATSCELRYLAFDDDFVHPMRVRGSNTMLPNPQSIDEQREPAAIPDQPDIEVEHRRAQQSGEVFADESYSER